MNNSGGPLQSPEPFGDRVTPKCRSTLTPNCSGTSISWIPPSIKDYIQNNMFQNDIPPACDMKYDLAWGENDRYSTYKNNGLIASKSIAQLTPYPRVL
jgi:hypothetical protein